MRWESQVGTWNDFLIEVLAGKECVVQSWAIFIRLDLHCWDHQKLSCGFLKEVAMLPFLLLLSVSSSVSADCRKSIYLVDYFLGFDLDYSAWEYSDEAVEWWTGEYDDDGNCVEPHYTYSCDPKDWSTDERNATLFTCSEKEGTCIDAALVCNGMSECPNGEDEVPGGLDCSKYECPYPELGGLKCDHSWAEWDTKLCIHPGWMCDGYEDCLGGEDETEDVGCSGDGSS